MITKKRLEAIPFAAALHPLRRKLKTMRPVGRGIPADPACDPRGDGPPPCPRKGLDATATRGWPLFASAWPCWLRPLDLVTKRVIFDRLGMPGSGPRVVLVPGIFVAARPTSTRGPCSAWGRGWAWCLRQSRWRPWPGIVAMVARAATRESRWLVVALALITGGILGNLYDRLGLPGLNWHAPLGAVRPAGLAVRDWIHVTVPG